MGNDTVAVGIARGAALGVGLTVGLGALGVFMFTGSLGGLGKMLGPATLYLLPALALQAAVALPTRRWMASLRPPMDWVLFVGVQLTVAGATAAVASFLMLVTGVAKSWNELVQANRVVIVAMVLITCAIELYSSTRSRLEKRNRQLEEKVETESRALQFHEQDFERAREIQQALMPTTLPQIQGCELAAGCQPARMVGGDYFDAIRLGDARAAIAIGDVAGKGMAAALLMSNLQAIVRAFAPALAPDELCAKANQLIAGNVAPGKYITFFYAVIDTARMTLDYCNAGHNPPILRRRDGTLESLREGGPVLGVIPAARYAAGAVELRSGDCLVLYTDGISEAFNAADEEFGEERLMGALDQPVGVAEESRQRIMAAVTEFSNGNFHDDATMMIVSMH